MYSHFGVVVSCVTRKGWFVERSAYSVYAELYFGRTVKHSVITWYFRAVSFAQCVTTHRVAREIRLASDAARGGVGRVLCSQWVPVMYWSCSHKRYLG